MPRLARLFAFVAAPLAAFAPVPVVAQSYVVTVEEWVEEVPASAARFVSPQHEQAEREAVAAFGPFRVRDPQTAQLVDVTNAASPRDFEAMLAAFPTIDTLEFVEAPGTHDDRANLRLGRMIRARGMATVVADGGSVRSGAVELFVAGATRQIESGAEFAVHGWLDDWGRGAEDYPAGAPEHRRYLDYYAEMGMVDEQARAFYAMTNSVPFDSARWLTGEEMQAWLAAPKIASKPRLAYLDLSAALQ